MNTSPHDELFRALLSDQGRAAAFLRDHLPNEITAHLSDDPLELVEGTYIDEDLRATQSDVLLRVQRREGGDAFVYVLIEHKSSPDAALPLQLAGYMIQIWLRHSGGRVGALRSLPPIIPIVVYNGGQRWNVPDGIAEMIQAGQGPSELCYLPGERYILRNLVELPLESLSTDPGLKAGFVAMRQEALEHLSTLVEGLHGKEDLQNQVIAYILSTYPDLTYADLQKKLRVSDYKDLEDVVGTIAETLIAEGKIAGIAEGEARGEAQGRARTLVRQMERRLGVLMPEVHNRIQSASVEQLDTWLDRILDAQSIDAVFEDMH